MMGCWQWQKSFASSSSSSSSSSDGSAAAAALAGALARELRRRAILVGDTVDRPMRPSGWLVLWSPVTSWLQAVADTSCM